MKQNNKTVIFIHSVVVFLSYFTLALNGAYQLFLSVSNEGYLASSPLDWVSLIVVFHLVFIVLAGWFFNTKELSDE